MRFASLLHVNISQAIALSQAISDREQTPCGVWGRDGWFTVCEIAPELIEPDPEADGWKLWAVTDPEPREDQGQSAVFKAMRQGVV